jgi:hypothetical protein
MVPSLPLLWRWCNYRQRIHLNHRRYLWSWQRPLSSVRPNWPSYQSIVLPSRKLTPHPKWSADLFPIYKIFNYGTKSADGHGWLMPVILTTQEAVIRRIIVQNHPRKIVPETLSWKTHHKKGMVEWCKV